MIHWHYERGYIPKPEKTHKLAGGYVMFDLLDVCLVWLA